MRVRYILRSLTVSLVVLSPYARHSDRAIAHSPQHDSHGSQVQDALSVFDRPASPTRGNPISALPVAVDGRQNPERIPDDIAYRHFMTATAIAAKPTEPQLARRKALLATVGLSQRDQLALIDALANVREQLDQIQSSRRQVSPESLVSVTVQVTLTELKQREERILQSARQRIDDSLTEEGSLRLKSHITQRVKPRVVIYGDAPR